MLTVSRPQIIWSRHCAGHHCPSAAWKAAVPCSTPLLNVTCSSELKCKSHCYFRWLTAQKYRTEFLSVYYSYCPLHKLLVSDCILHLSVSAVMLRQPYVIVNW
jgi:hypothetical protein